jgi:hypothetical protein|eukprot:COSAG01_NODE_1226_length_11140_cov_73.834798_9_plen_103_part_00
MLHRQTCCAAAVAREMAAPCLQSSFAGCVADLCLHCRAAPVRRHRGGQLQPAGSASGGHPQPEAEALIERLARIELAVVHIQRVWRGWLGRRRLLQVALSIA